MGRTTMDGKGITMSTARPSGRYLYVKVIDDSLPRNGIAETILTTIRRIELTEEQQKQLSVRQYEILIPISIQEG